MLHLSSTCGRSSFPRNCVAFVCVCVCLCGCQQRVVVRMYCACDWLALVNRWSNLLLVYAVSILGETTTTTRENIRQFSHSKLKWPRFLWDNDSHQLNSFTTILINSIDDEFGTSYGISSLILIFVYFVVLTKYHRQYDSLWLE